ncbi:MULTISPECIES: pilus assembly protein TadG-related protein [unclassified Pseudomonas]|uniref:pilus assembly protein TadG-related protein n=1 Tax=unclassified Pseudomonas TaxID=196821 RepID=UPI0010557FB5|nr:pilus assembly protein TadG-related protein [Pseudomonas sp. MS-1(2024)]MEC4166171.1 pilus assembly protein TadG-related protein [Pseudomonas sp. MS-1(2024)]
MSPQLRGIGFTGPQQQRGAIGLMAAVTLGMVLLFMLLVVDSGRLYLEQRKLQRVADMAALEVVSRGGNCKLGTAKDYSEESAKRNGFTSAGVQSVTPTCGTLTTNEKKIRVFQPSIDNSGDVIQVVAKTTVPTSVAGGFWSALSKGTFEFNTKLQATAVGAKSGSPLAQLTIRNKTLALSDSKSKILSSLFKGLLGGSVDISILGWDGIANTNIKLLSFLDRLKLDLDLKAGGYDEVLSSKISIGQLIDSTIHILDPSDTLSTTAKITTLKEIKANAGATKVILGDLLKVQGSNASSALNIDMNLLDLISGYVQLASKNQAIVASFPIDLSLTKITATVQVIQPPQLSAIGNPALAAKETKDGEHRIYVRTAQVRTLVSVELPALKNVQALVDAVTTLGSSLVDTLKKLLDLDIVGALGCALGAKCTNPSLLLLSDKIDIYIDAPSAESYVTAYSCSSESSKTLTATTNTSIVDIKFGTIDKNQIFPSSTTAPLSITVKPLSVIDIGLITCSKPAFSEKKCDPRVPLVGGGIGISLDTSVGSNLKQTHTFGPDKLLGISLPPLYYQYSTNGIVKSLSNTLDGINVHIYQPLQGNVLWTLIGGLDGLLSTVKPLLLEAINKVLSPVLDRIIDTLLLGLGVDLNQVDVGANLSCNQGGRAQLVL